MLGRAVLLRQWHGYRNTAVRMRALAFPTSTKPPLLLCKSGAPSHASLGLLNDWLMRTAASLLVGDGGDADDGSLLACRTNHEKR